MKHPHEYTFERQAVTRWLATTPQRLVSVWDVVQRFRVSSETAVRWLREERIANDWVFVTPISHDGCEAGTGPQGAGRAGYLNGVVPPSSARRLELCCEHCDEMVDMSTARVEAPELLLPPLDQRVSACDRCGWGQARACQICRQHVCACTCPHGAQLCAPTPEADERESAEGGE